MRKKFLLSWLSFNTFLKQMSSNFQNNMLRIFVKNQSESHFSIWSHLLTFDARDKLTSGACLCFETHVKKICFSFFRKIIGQYKKIKVVGNPNLRWELNLPKVLTGQPPIPPAKKTFYSNFWSLCFKIHLVHDYVKSCKMLSFFFENFWASYSISKKLGVRNKKNYFLSIGAAQWILFITHFISHHWDLVLARKICIVLEMLTWCWYIIEIMKLRYRFNQIVLEDHCPLMRYINIIWQINFHD